MIPALVSSSHVAVVVFIVFVVVVVVVVARLSSVLVVESCDRHHCDKCHQKRKKIGRK
jgi:hypothetical protein